MGSRPCSPLLNSQKMATWCACVLDLQTNISKANFVTNCLRHQTPSIKQSLNKLPVQKLDEGVEVSQTHEIRIALLLQALAHLHKGRAKTIQLLSSYRFCNDSETRIEPAKNRKKEGWHKRHHHEHRNLPSYPPAPPVVPLCQLHHPLHPLWRPPSESLLRFVEAPLRAVSQGSPFATKPRRRWKLRFWNDFNSMVGASCFGLSFPLSCRFNSGFSVACSWLWFSCFVFMVLMLCSMVVLPHVVVIYVTGVRLRSCFHGASNQMTPPVALLHVTAEDSDSSSSNGIMGVFQ